jgi:guanylate kinase
MGKMLVIYGPSTAGKTELQKVITCPSFPKVITSTSRPIRKGEVNGKDYHFFTEREFKRKIQAGAFLEWAEYNGHYYGTLKRSIQEVLESPYHASIIMEINGVRALKAMFPKAVKTLYIALDLPSLTRRLKERGSSKAEIDWRLANAEHEELSGTYMDLADAQIWNSDEVPFHETMKRVKKILEQWDMI